MKKQAEKQSITPEVSALAAKQETLTLPEALSILHYLSDKKALCDLCGYRLVTKENQVYAVCEKCECTLNQNFNPRLRKAGALDVFLCKKLTEWADSVFKGESSAFGGTAGNQGDG